MSEDKILAEVNGYKVTQSEVEKYIRLIGQMQLNNEQGYKQVAKELVNRRLLLEEAKKEELDQAPAFKQMLKKQEDELLTSYKMQKLFEGIEVSDQEAKEYYQQHKELFKAKATFHAKHILVKEEDKAKEIKQKIDDGSSFEDLAKEYSLDGAAKNGGDLGEFPEGTMVNEFEEALKKMNEGEISNPVKTQFGYHLIKLVSKKDASIYEYDEIKDSLKNQLIAMKRQEIYLNKTKELEKDAQIKTYF
ncbi:MAG: peptidylprolyl isomerase [Tissierellia bacterium]|nr:peptidylprolyl isomerase [Tissierellia bacterium]